MEQNMHSNQLKNLVLPLTILMMVSSCSLLSTRAIEVTAKPMERKIVQPVMPREIDLSAPQWIVVNPDNWEDQLEKIRVQEGELVFLAMTVPDYELMSMNMKELENQSVESPLAASEQLQNANIQISETVVVKNFNENTGDLVRCQLRQCSVALLLHALCPQHPRSLSIG